MKKYAKIKNPCKVCSKSVTNKNGLKCKGACRKWAHYTCLNYTPEKIQDLKSGFITVTCPCPNCNTEIKEFPSNSLTTCDNKVCPSNAGPICGIIECPVIKVKGNPIPGFATGGGLPLKVSPDKARSNPQRRHGFQQTEPPYVTKTDAKNGCLLGSGISLAKDGSAPGSQLSNSAKSREESMKRSAVILVKSQSCSCWFSDKMVEKDVRKNYKRNDEIKKLQPKIGDSKISSSDTMLIVAKQKENEKAILCTIHDLCSTVENLSRELKKLMSKIIKAREQAALK